MGNKSILKLSANTLELHYWFTDESHTMNAVIQNRCEYEFLGVIKEIAAKFNSEIIVETEPFLNGGFIRRFKIICKEENKKAIITTALIVSLATSIFITPITTAISKVTENFIESIFEDKELKELEKEKLRLEIEILKHDFNAGNHILNQNNIIKKKRSNFYQFLENYKKVKQISIIIETENNSPFGKEHFVDRNEFNKFILITDDLEPIEIEHALIEIVSPVLKKGKYKWRGIYNGDTISFNMKSKEFRKLVQTGEIQFKNGTTINCFLEIKKKIDNEGLEIIVGYDVLRVNSYFENEKSVETNEGKQFRRKREGDKQQKGLFDNPEIE